MRVYNINSGKWQIEPLEIAQILTPAIAAARTLAAPKAESYALGTLGKLYEQNQQWQDAQKITQQALVIAEQIQAVDLIARWQWQQGRLFTNQGQTTQAISAYQEAVNSWQSLRADLVNIHRDVQFSFKETVEPVYRELVRLLVQEPTNQANLQQARQVIESLQVAELDNFFREACLAAKPIKIAQIDPTAAVIYPIILADRLAVILSLPGADLSYYETKLPETEIVARLEHFQIYLNPAFFDSDRLQVSQTIYNWLIRPAEPHLAASGIETLVFVLDSALRSLPIAALYDGQQYLIAKYSLALAPGLQLLNVDSVPGEKLSILMGGLSEGREMFSPLPGVETELTEISHILKSDLLLNQRFTNPNLAAKINSLNVPVVHIATHGQFSSQVEDTFILTWDGKMNVQEFNSILRSRSLKFSRPLELLVLSACQTATGDRRQKKTIEMKTGAYQSEGKSAYIVSLRDITEHKQSELALKQAKEVAEVANRAKSTFLAKMTHEFRTPLHAILGFTKIIQRDASLTPEHQEYLNIILRSSQHLLELINDVLDLSKIEAGQVTLNENTVNLHQLLSTVQEMMQSEARSKNLPLIFEMDDRVPNLVKTDEQKLRQVLINLVGNAIKFTQQGETIVRVTTVDPHNLPQNLKHQASANARLCFEVEDTGPGIPPEDFEYLFQPFVQTTTGRFVNNLLN
jgi:CHAT domain-containing protein